MVPPLIALEEHFLCSAVLDQFDEALQEQFKALPQARNQLKDLDAIRLRDMDEGHISKQIISHLCAPAPMPAETCVKANNELAAAVATHPARFAGFAVLPVADPAAAARELTRSVQELGFVGALIDNHANGQFFDTPAHDALWRAAETLDVPVYLHPTFPADEMLSRYHGDSLTPGAGRSLAASSWGWHTETGLHVLRLFAAGVFDRFPRLKLVIGHFGEMIPYHLERIFALSRRWGERQRDFRRVWDENIWVTTSGVWSLNPLRCMLHNTRVDRILYSVDYPFANNASGLKWMEELEASGLVTPEELEMIAYKNSEKLLRVKAVVANGSSR